jgi:hypothetical protein
MSKSETNLNEGNPKELPRERIIRKLLIAERAVIEKKIVSHSEVRKRLARWLK